MNFKILENDRSFLGFAEAQGARPHMEDSSLFRDFRDCGYNVQLHAIFDGHGGDKTSNFLANCFDIKFEQTILPFLNGSETEIRLKINTLFCEIDDEIMRLNFDSGSTAIILIMTETKYICINLGDSRCILRRNNYEIVQLSYDQKPMNEIERNRVIKAGCCVLNGGINGILFVARAFGDFIEGLKLIQNIDQKDQPVSCVPEVIFQNISPNDQQIIIACDGLWDVMNNCQVCEFLANRDNAQMEDKITDLVSFAILNLKTNDNVSVILIELKKIE